MSGRPRTGAPLAVTLMIAGVLFGAPAIAPAAPSAGQPAIDAVGAVGITVADLDRSVAFYRDVLSFSVAKQEEATGAPVEQLEGVFGAHVRSARLELGSEAIVLVIGL